METEKNKPGRPKKIKKPLALWELFAAYRSNTKSNPIIIVDWVGKDAIRVNREKERPLTMEGFENYCEDKNIIVELKDYFSNKDYRYDEFAPICTRIRREIRQNHIEGGMTGIFNTSITQRLNNLVEHVEQVFIEQPLFPVVKYSK